MDLKKTFLFFMIALVGTSCAVTRGSVRAPQAAFVKVYTKISVLECHKNSKLCKPKVWGSTGSGVVVRSGLQGTYVLTAGHVCNVHITKAGLKEIKSLQIEISVLSFENKLYKSNIIHSNEINDGEPDLCLLDPVGLNLKNVGVRISKREPRVGDRLYSMGAPAGIYHPPTVAILEGIYSGLMPDRQNFLSSIPAVGGSSGSPVLNSKMQLVGIIFASHPSFNHISISTGFNETRDFLKKHLD